MSEMTSSIGSLRYGQGEIPWFRRRVTLFAAFGVLVVLFLLLPPPGSGPLRTQISLALFAVAAVTWTWLYISDPTKSEWSKTLVASRYWGWACFSSTAMRMRSGAGCATSFSTGS